MDGIDEYKDDPMHWATMVVLDYIVKGDSEQFSEFNVRKILDETGAYEFIVENFAEEGFDRPSKSEIISRVLGHKLQN